MTPPPPSPPPSSTIDETVEALELLASGRSSRVHIPPGLSSSGYGIGIGNNTWPFDEGRNDEMMIKRYKGWVYACASRNARSVAQMSCRLYAITKRGQRLPRAQTRDVSPDHLIFLTNSAGPYIASLLRQADKVQEITEHPFLELMKKPNPYQDGFELLELLILYQELLGDSYTFKSRDRLHTIRELWPLLSHRVKIIPHPKNFIKVYRYGNRPTALDFKPIDIMHGRYPNPASLYYGMGPLQASTMAVRLNDYMDTYEESLFKNKAQPGTLLVPEYPLQGEARLRLEEDFNRRMAGAANTGKTLVAPAKMKLEQFAFSPRDMSALLKQRATKEEIAAIFDIPPTLMTPSGTRAKTDADEYIYCRYGIRPRLTRLAQTLNRDIVSEYDDRLFCAFDNPVPSDKEHDLKRKIADLRAGVTFINEEREAQGLQPVPWGSEPILPMNMAPMSQAQELREKKQEQPQKTPKDEDVHPTDDTKPGRNREPGKDQKGMR